jgi:hypothetical protein
VEGHEQGGTRRLHVSAVCGWWGAWCLLRREQQLLSVKQGAGACWSRLRLVFGP